MTIYIDADYKCHTAPAENLAAIETAVFDGKCRAWIEGFRLVPEGQTWTREDGEVFVGGMVAPWMELPILESAQAQYEESLAELQDMQAALELLGVTPTEEVTDNG